MYKKVTEINGEIIIVELLDQRGENQSTMPSNATEPKPRRETTSSMQIISPGKEINCFEGTGLNGFYPMRIILFLIESKALKGERRPTYWCMFAILSSLFFLCFSLFFSLCLLLCYDFLLEITITLLVPHPYHAWQGPFL